MSNEAQSSPAPEELRGVRLVRFISEHFAVFSLLGAVFVVLCSTLFLYGYLTVFDRQLIWIIEYPDILKEQVAQGHHLGMHSKAFLISF